jgi:hypothetical protein
MTADLQPQGFIQKLKEHLLPKIRSILATEIASLPTVSVDTAGDTSNDWQAVLLKQDRIYRHHIMRIYHTTYDVRRDEDVLHTNTSHCNVMVLDSSSPLEHPFRYAQVLGIYHANVIYIGNGDVIDYQPRRLEFLWVRWYQVDDPSGGWDVKRLDRVRFPPMNREDSFGFLDPADVLRSCHIVPAFSRGRVHADGIGISHLAKDSNDWKAYYINRLVFARSTARRPV